MELLEQPAEVLEEFAAGDLNAFESLFRQYQGEVYGWIVRVVRDPAAAEDLTIETFWRIHRAHARFDPRRSFGAWARRIATNVAIDYLKSAPVREVPLDQDLAAPSRSTSGGADPALQREVRERTQLAFHQLPAKLRAVATLSLIEDVSHREIGEALNLSTAAVKSRLFRAIRMLRRKLANLDTSHD
ncbi:MAG TPA: sigma-70 family RNA polymerase sigma factor [Candidatus Sulfotelmatobacter sp.]|nr:sigma-70 family RNA polymerase sigma factor [Candidatus Sulfotelmatobacter sp.]